MSTPKRNIELNPFFILFTTMFRWKYVLFSVFMSSFQKMNNRNYLSIWTSITRIFYLFTLLLFSSLYCYCLLLFYFLFFIYLCHYFVVLTVHYFPFLPFYSIFRFFYFFLIICPIDIFLFPLIYFYCKNRFTCYS